MSVICRHRSKMIERVCGTCGTAFLMCRECIGRGHGVSTCPDCERAKRKAAQQSVHLTGGILRRHKHNRRLEVIPLGEADSTPPAIR